MTLENLEHYIISEFRILALYNIAGAANIAISVSRSNFNLVNYSGTSLSNGRVKPMGPFPSGMVLAIKPTQSRRILD